MTRAAMVLCAMIVIGVLSGCASPDQMPMQWGDQGTGAWVTKEDSVRVGEQPQLGSEAGVAGVQPAVPEDSSLMDIDLATMGARWNEGASTLDSGQLTLESFTLLYQRTALGFGTRIGDQDWHTLVGGVDYETGRVFHAVIEFAPWEHQQRPEPVYQLWVDSIYCLIYAADTAVDMTEAQAIASRLGVHEGDGERESVLEENGIEYRFTVDTLRQTLRVTGAR